MQRAYAFERKAPDVRTGLTSAEVQMRVNAGAVNVQDVSQTNTVGKIIRKNTLTLFNVIILALAVLIIIVGSPQNTLFVGTALCNSLMGIFQELRAKKTLDKLSLLAQGSVNVVRDGYIFNIPQDNIVLDDIIEVKAGDQICADARVIQSAGLELDESLLTGETDRILKKPGDTVLSGSFATAGRAFVQVTAVGADNYAGKITADVQNSKQHKSKLLHTLNMIIKVLAIIIVPVGFMLFYASYSRGDGLQTAVLGAASAMTGMIPSGLVLLTGVTLTVGALTLAKKKALVQSLPSIETLARVDMLCLDKTGTITDGDLIFEEIVPLAEKPAEQISRIISELMNALGDQNATANCLRAKFGQTNRWQTTAAVPFTSDRKWSGATFNLMGTFVLGAPKIIFRDMPEDLRETIDSYAAKGFRVLCLASSKHPLSDSALPAELECDALLLMSDSIRQNAAETFKYFADEGVTIKVISGDNPTTVGAVALQAGIANSDRTIDMSTVPDNANYSQIVEQNTVFGHVSPQQKQLLIRAMQANGHTTCMTGDGVNDILAMRESDCSVSMVGGSSAARSACDFVLMSDDFGVMVQVLREGRRVINNIERVSTLYLVNTIFSVLLSIIYTILPIAYPYAPLQMTPINAFTVGIPSFFLALQPRYDRPQGKMMSNIFEHSFPAALTIVFNTLYLQAASYLFELDPEQTSTMVVFMIGIVGFYLLFRISKPFTRGVKVMLGLLIAGFIMLFLFAGDIFTLDSLIHKNVFFYLPLVYFSFHIHGFLGNVCSKLLKAYSSFKEKRGRELEIY